MTIRKAHRRVVKSAGLNPDEVLRHTFRHTAITHLVQAGVDLPTVQKVRGHKTLAMVARYVHANGEHIDAAMDNRPGIAEAIWLKLCGHGCVVQHGVVSFLRFGGRDVADGREQSPVVEPVHPFKRGVFNGFKGPPGAPPVFRCLAQDLVGLAKLAVLALQCLQTVGQLGRNAGTLAAVYLGLLHPLQQRVPRAADHGRYGCDRCPAG